jgi:hypothetical protein
LERVEAGDAGLVEAIRLSVSAEHWRVNTDILTGKRFDMNEILGCYARAALAAVQEASK